jgi:hypothetical protein
MHGHPPENVLTVPCRPDMICALRSDRPRGFGPKRVATPANWHGARTGTGGRKRPIVTRDGLEAAADLLCDRSIVAEPSRMANWR